MRVFADKTLTHHILGNATEVQLWVATYSNGRVALQLLAPMQDMPKEAGYMEPYMTPSTNLHKDPCGPDEVYIKTWGENEGIAEWLHENGIICWPAVAFAESGYVRTPRYRLTPEMVAEVTGVLTKSKQWSGKRKERGEIKLQLLCLALAGIAFVQLFCIGMLLVNIDHNLAMTVKAIQYATCHTDTECEDACEAIGKQGCRE